MRNPAPTGDDTYSPLTLTLRSELMECISQSLLKLGVITKNTHVMEEYIWKLFSLCFISFL